MVTTVIMALSAQSSLLQPRLLLLLSLLLHVLVLLIAPPLLFVHGSRRILGLRFTFKRAGRTWDCLQEYRRFRGSYVEDLNILTDALRLARQDLCKGPELIDEALNTRHRTPWQPYGNWGALAIGDWVALVRA